jgi:hypothetical protein
VMHDSKLKNSTRSPESKTRNLPRSITFSHAASREENVVLIPSEPERL